MYLHDRRQSVRKQVNKISAIQLEGMGAFRTGFVKDISRRGMCLYLRQKLKADKTIRFKLKTHLNNAFDSDIIESWIQWHRFVHDGSIYGLSFLTLKEPDKEAISNFVCAKHGRPTEGQEPTSTFEDSTVRHLQSAVSLLNKGEQKGGRGMPGEDYEDKRIFERLAVNLPVRFLDVSSNKEGVGKTEDISAKGLGFYTDEPLLPMTPLEMWVDLPDKGESLYTRGEVVWSRLSGNKYRAGINLERADLMGMSRLLRLA